MDLAVKRRSCNRVALLAMALVVCLGEQARAQLRDAFEGPQATWTLSQADCGVKLIAQERTYRQSHGGQASEHIRLFVGNGTFVYLTQPIGRAPVIAELRPSLFLKSDRASVQLLARVVFPRSIDRGTGLPVTAFLPGDAYTEVGQWQQLVLREADKLVGREAVAQRTTRGSSFDPAEAYVDLLVINAYSAPGNIDLWIDDLEIQGYINLDESRPANAPQVPRDGSGLPASSAAMTGPVSQLRSPRHPASGRAARLARVAGVQRRQAQCLAVRQGAARGRAAGTVACRAAALWRRCRAPGRPGPGRRLEPWIAAHRARCGRHAGVD
jgi:hypothetical protein